MNTAEAEADARTAASITIDRPASDLRALWLRPDTQSRIWSHFAEVTPSGNRAADWVAHGPAGGEYRWRTNVVDGEADGIRWTTEDGGDVPNVGVLTFRPAPSDRGTELHLDVRFDPPGGAIGQAVAKLFHIAPREIVRTALYRFRALALTGEIPTTDPSARRPERWRGPLGDRPMRALCWNGVNDLRVETVADPEILNPNDVILKVRLSTTCGSDLHLIDGLIPTMREGDVLGHEFMGEIVDVGREVSAVKKGDRVVVPSFISCGKCWYCQHDLYSLCDTTHPKPELQEPLLGYPTAGIYAYSHAFGGYAGAHAQYVRVPFADTDCFKVPDGVSDEAALFIWDAAPTGFMGADFCNIHRGDVVAVWGCGGVGLMAQQSAMILGAERVIAIDRYPERLAKAEAFGAIPLDYTDVDVVEALKELTGGRGPDSCIDAVGMEAGGTGLQQAYDRVKQALYLETDRGAALRQAMLAVRKGGTLSILGVYGVMDKFPLGLLMNKGVTVRTAQQHGQAYVPRLLEYAQRGDLTPAALATHRFSLEDGPTGYRMFKHKDDGCLRAVFVQ